jgi:predicted nucleic acid-binding protein
MGPEDRLATASRVGFDTSPFIYLVEGTGARAARAAEVFARVSSASKATSIITPIEVLTFFQGVYRSEMADKYRGYFREPGEVEVILVDWPVAELAASLRGKYRLRLGDSIQVATAILFRADIFLTNDRGLSRVTEIPVLILDDLPI